MVNMLVTYYTKTGNTETMAKGVERGAKEGSADTRLKKVKDGEK